MAALLHFATISNDPAAYAGMRRSMAAVGYDESRCRFTLFDNAAENRHEPYAVLRSLAGDGDEPYVVLCHQDLVFGLETSCDALLAILADLDRRDGRWAVAGDAGFGLYGEPLLYLDEPGGSFRMPGLPRRAQSLDENFLVFPRARFPRPTPGLSGFHLYGTDVVLAAIRAGGAGYVVPFPVTHLSSGNPESPAFEAARAALARAWAPRLLVGVIDTTCARVRVSCVGPLHRLLQHPRVAHPLRRWGLGLVRNPFAR